MDFNLPSNASASIGGKSRMTDATGVSETRKAVREASLTVVVFLVALVAVTVSASLVHDRLAGGQAEAPGLTPLMETRQ